MAEPNFATIMSAYGDALDIFNEIELDTNASGGNLISFFETALNSVEGSFNQAARGIIEATRRTVAATLSQNTTRAMVEAYLPQISQSIDSPFTGSADFNSIWRDLYDYMIDNSQTIQESNFTFGSVSAGGGNTGTGTVIRLNTDEQNFDREGWFADSYSVECTADARQTGEDHVATFKFEGSAAAIDELSRTGTGIVQEGISASNGRDTKTWVRNPSFNTMTGTVASNPTAIDGWDVAGSFSNLTISQTAFRTTPGDTNSYGLQFDTNETVSQNLVTVNRTQINPDVPYYVRVAVYRFGTADGTLTITLGGATNSVSRAVTISTLSNGAWNIVDLVATPGQDNWPLAWNDNALTLTFAYTGNTTGNIVLDDIIFQPFVRVGARGDARLGRGSMGNYIFIDGRATPFLLKDSFTFSDTLASRPILQYFQAVAGRGYLPHAASPTVSDP